MNTNHIIDQAAFMKTIGHFAPTGGQVAFMDTTDYATTTSTMRFKPMPSDHEIEKARKSMTRHRFIEWLAKRTAAAQADPSTAVEPYPIFDRTDRRIADRVAPQENGVPRRYKGDPKRTEPYSIARVASASETKGPADYRKPD